SQSTHAPRLAREDGAIEWEGVSAIEVDRRVRALQPWPGVTAPFGGQRVRLLAGQVRDPDSHTAVPGTAVATEGEDVDVAASAGVYRIGFVQPAGGRPMTAAAYLRGRRPPAP